MREVILESVISSFGLTKKQLSQILDVHYQTVIGWCNGRSEIAYECKKLFLEIENLFFKFFDFSYRFFEHHKDTERRKIQSYIYIPIFLRVEDYIINIAFDTNYNLPIEVYRMLSFNVARAWRQKDKGRIGVVLVEFNGQKYKQWCEDNHLDHALEKTMILWMKNMAKNKYRLDSDTPPPPYI